MTPVSHFIALWCCDRCGHTALSEAELVDASDPRRLAAYHYPPDGWLIKRGDHVEIRCIFCKHNAILEA